MEELTALRPAGVHLPAGYSHAVRVSGPILCIAGQAPLGPAGELVGPGDFAAQVEQALTNLDLVLAAAGLAFPAVAALTLYVSPSVARADLGALREPLRRRSGAAPPPAITLLFVQGLMDPDWLIEIQATAVGPEGAGA
jgi:enamine deaminase RidA (YjgF/YER057c/UK114 family)